MEPNLTEREVEVTRLRDEEKLTWAKIAERLGTAKGSVNASYRQAMAKIDRAANPEKYPSKLGQGHLSEVKRPEETAAVIDAATDPFMTIKAAAKQCNFPESTLKALMRRMKTAYQPVNEAIRKLKDDEMVLLLEDRAHRCVTFIDDLNMGGAGVKDLAISAGVLIDKARLIKGEPTIITRPQDIKDMDKLEEMLVAELQRRGRLIDVTPEKLPGPSPQEVPDVGS